jgi:hypothetical protein
MFRSIFGHPQRDIFFFTSVTKDKIIWFVVACLLYLLCFVLMLLHALPSLVVAVLYSNNQTRESTQQHQHKAQQV